jgi:hypothetical protein
MATGLALTASTGSPAETLSVSTEVFDQIIALLNERPDIAPVLEATSRPRPATRSPAAQRCLLEPRDVVLSVPKGTPDPALGPDRSRYEIEKVRLPVLLDRRAKVPAAKGGSALLVATNVMAVNSDGSPRSYHPLDAFGTCKTSGSPAADAGAPCAINLLCNAGVRVYEGARPIRCGQREDYQRAWDEMWGLIATGRAVRIPESYLARDPDRSSDRRYGFFHPERPVTVLFKDTIIPHDTNKVPCVRNVAGTRYEGFFVAATSLKGRERRDEAEGHVVSRIVKDRRCSPIPFVNAETLPNIVIPKGGFAGAKVGDLVVGYRKEPSGEERWVYGIVGDEGPNDKFGEGSMAFNAALRGIPVRPWDSYRDIARNLHIGDRASKKETVGLLILRGTGGLTRKDMSTASVERQSRRAFQAWAKGSLAAAQNRFRACLEAVAE